ncbi:MAG: OpgC domain-containing protein [Candidatus Saccharimonas sp.]
MSEELAIKKPSSRIATFDLLRGYFLIVILCNHLDLYPNLFAPLTGEGILYVSSAEGFFLISGIVLGIVRGRKLIHRPFSEPAGKLLKRSLQLYVTSIVLTLAFTLIAWILSDMAGVKYGAYAPRGDVFGLLWNTLTYQYTYGWADFLRHYALFIFVSPIALWLLRKGQWVAVLLASAAVWCLFPLGIVDSYMAQPISWQFIFFSGFVIGFYWDHIANWWRTRFTPKMRTVLGVSLVVALFVTAALSATLVFSHYLGNSLGDRLTDIHHEIEWMFDKDRLPIPRLLLGAVWFWGLFWLVRRFEHWVLKRLGWILQPFGENSLYVYTIQAFVIFFVHILLVQFGISRGFWIDTCITSIAVAIVYLAVKKNFLTNVIPR